MGGNDFVSHRSRSLLAILGVLLLNATTISAQTNYVCRSLIELSDNGAWSWFMDERAIIDRGYLLVGSVRAIGKFENSTAPGWGNVELSTLDLKTLKHERFILHEHFEQDDHDAPGLLVLRDGRYLAAYSKHNQDPRSWFRISSRPHDTSEWMPEVEMVTPGVKGNWGGDNFTYCNPMMLSAEGNRIYLFHRGVSQDPNYLTSADDGRTWTYGGKLFDGRHGYSPYTKYACNGRDIIHFVATEDHPRNYDNSLYHGFIRNGKVYQSDGRLFAPLSTGTNTSIRPWNLTRVYQGGPTNVAWMSDFELDKDGNPVVLFTIQVDGAGLPRGQGGMDHRFHYARWDGQYWHEAQIAFAGTRLYAGEDDYTGLGSINPQDTSIVYISTDAEPHSGEPLISKADSKRHHELYRGVTTDGGKSWTWTTITSNSTTDNLRPLVPVSKDPQTALIWMRGGYWNNRGEWTTKVVALVMEANAH